MTEKRSGRNQAIRAEREAGSTYAEIAKRHGISPQRAGEICRGHELARAQLRTALHALDERPDLARACIHRALKFLANG